MWGLLEPKLLRRGADIDQVAHWLAMADLKITDVMRPFPACAPGSPGRQPRPGGRARRR
jgi:hypothetical protein